MSKKIQLQIPSPCHEKWNNMLPAEKGKFCLSCNKEVVDFTTMSDSQLVAFFKKPATGSVCGRLMKDQLQRELLQPKRSLPWIKYFFQLALPAMMVSLKANSRSSFIQGKVMAGQLTTKELKPIVKHNFAATKISTEIKGQVVDERGEPVPYASVVIKGTKHGVAGDSIGNFILKINPDNEIITIAVSAVGFQTREKTIHPDSNNLADQLVVLSTNTMEEIVLVSGVTISCKKNYTVGFTMTTTGEVIKRDTLMERTKFALSDTLAKFKSIFNSSNTVSFSIYPNPVNASSLLTLQNKGLATDNYSLEIRHASGQLVHSNRVAIVEKQVFKFSMPPVSAGIYFITLVNKRGNKYTERIVVR